MAWGKYVAWDVTDNIANSYLSATDACCAAEGAASRKEVKYATLENSYIFIRLVFEIYGSINAKDTQFKSSAAVSERLVTILARQRFSFNMHLNHTAALQRYCIH